MLHAVAIQNSDLISNGIDTGGYNYRLVSL